jgi:hypothetical protein
MQCAVTLPNGEIPPRPDAATVSRGVVETFAIDTFFLGETDRSGTASSQAWKAYGYDLDGLTTYETSTDVCDHASGAPRSNQVDGDYGIDNATGFVLTPILVSAVGVSTLSATTSQFVQDGHWTLQIQVDGMSGKDVEGIAAQVLVSGAYDQGAPAFDTSTDWPVLASSVRDGGALVRYENAYVTSDGIFVSGVVSSNPIVVPLLLPTNPKSPIHGALAALPLRIHQATITFERSSDDPTRLINGTIAGVLYTEEIVDAARTCAGQMDTSLCNSAFNGFADQLRQAQDILQDGTNAQGVPCDAISIGVGFTARLVANPTKVVPDPQPLPDACPSP